MKKQDKKKNVVVKVKSADVYYKLIYSTTDKLNKNNQAPRLAGLQH